MRVENANTNSDTFNITQVSIASILFLHHYRGYAGTSLTSTVKPYSYKGAGFLSARQLSDGLTVDPSLGHTRVPSSDTTSGSFEKFSSALPTYREISLFISAT